MRIASWNINGVRLIISLALPLVASAAGAIFTANSLSTWYQALEKPAWNPPSWVFGPVWTVLYIAMGIAYYRIWMRTGTGQQEALNMATITPDGTVRVAPEFKERIAQALNGAYAMAAYGAQLALNVMWSAFFFGLRQPGVGFFIIGALWVAIAITLALFYRIDRIAGRLLIPYLAWVSFAVTLNFAIWKLNA